VGSRLPFHRGLGNTTPSPAAGNSTQLASAQTVSPAASAAVAVPAAQSSAIMKLAGAGAAGNLGQPASSTWPGYSNLVYCDPVECSGPMPVVHVKVPVNQGKPNADSASDGYVNADVVIGPDGVARAIRTAN
jgi:hypothetical protein